MIWVRFDYGEGRFLEKEFATRNEMYEFLDGDGMNIKEWHIVKPPGTPKVKETV